MFINQSSVFFSGAEKFGTVLLDHLICSVAVGLLYMVLIFFTYEEEDICIENNICTQIQMVFTGCIDRC